MKTTALISGLALLAVSLTLPHTLLAEEEFPVPEGFELQVLDPTGGKIARPEGWHYMEDHRQNKLKWIFSKENPEHAPYRTGVMFQLFINPEEQAGMPPEAISRDFLSGRISNAKKVIRQFPDTQDEFMMRAGVEVIEEVNLYGKTEDHHVVYSVFWKEGLPLFGVMSAGCPATEWSQNADLFNVMSHVEVIDRKHLLAAAQKMEAPAGNPSTKQEVLKAIEVLKTTPLKAVELGAAKTILDFAENSPDVMVRINLVYLPGLSNEEQSAANGLMLASFMGGNLAAQLEKGVKEDHPLEGLKSALTTYRQLKEADAVPVISDYEHWLTLDDKELKALVDKIESERQPE